MKETLQNALLELINRAVTGLDAGVAFLGAELPEVVRQLLLYNMAVDVFFILLAVSATILSYLSVKQFIKWEAQTTEKAYSHETKRDKAGAMSGVFLGTTIVSGCIALVLIIIALVVCADLLKLWLAPKVWLVQYAADLIK